MATKALHIGEYLRNLAEANRMSAPEIGEKISMSAQGVREIFKKEQVHMKNIEDFSKLFGVNIYAMLSRIWEGEELSENIESSPTMVQEPAAIYRSQPTDSPITITLQVGGSKKEKILKILMD